MSQKQKKTFRGFGLGIMRRIHGTKIDEADLVIRECRQLIRGGVFFDVGANVGTVSEAMLPHASKIVAMEPEPGSYAALVKRLGAHAVCINALIGPEGADRTFLFHSLASTSSTSVTPGDEPVGHDYLKRMPMKAVSLDAVAQQHGLPSLIKIDVEGFELSVLESAKTVLASKPAVVMEFNALCLANFGRVNPRDAIDRILAIFPKVELITQTDRTLVTDPYFFLSENILAHGSVDNLVCTWD